MPLLGLVLALGLPEAPAMDCGSLGPATRLTFTPVARARWLAPRVRAPGPLDHLYSTVRHFLSSVQLNPFPAGECGLPQEGLGRNQSWPAPLSSSVWGAWKTGFSAFPTPIFLPRSITSRPLQDLLVQSGLAPSLSLSFSVLK